jgi:hypothetical protein
VLSTNPVNGVLSHQEEIHSVAYAATARVFVSVFLKRLAILTPFLPHTSMLIAEFLRADAIAFFPRRRRALTTRAKAQWSARYSLSSAGRRTERSASVQLSS